MIDSLLERTTECPNGQVGATGGCLWGSDPLLTPRLGFTRARGPGCSRVDDSGATCPPSPFDDYSMVSLGVSAYDFCPLVVSQFSSSSDASPPRISPLLFLMRFLPVFYHRFSPHYASRIVSSPLFAAPLWDSLLVRFVFSPRKVRFCFP